MGRVSRGKTQGQFCFQDVRINSFYPFFHLQQCCLWVPYYTVTVKEMWCYIFIHTVYLYCLQFKAGILSPEANETQHDRSIVKPCLLWTISPHKNNPKRKQCHSNHLNQAFPMCSWIQQRMCQFSIKKKKEIHFNTFEKKVLKHFNHRFMFMTFLHRHTHEAQLHSRFSVLLGLEKWLKYFYPPTFRS